MLHYTKDEWYNINMKQIDITGKVFNDLTVLSFAFITRGKDGISYRCWYCKCKCGEIKAIRGKDLKSGNTKSCGCRHGLPTTKTHGMSKTRFHKIFFGILKRCNNLKCSNYSDYGGRGIKCLWKDFESFRKDMYESYVEHENKHGKDTTIDRINNNGHYSKKNCRWVTYRENTRNKRTTVYIKYKGESLSLSDWSDRTGVPYKSLWHRIKVAKWPIEKAFTISS